jgi:hypothetical protein
MVRAALEDGRLPLIVSGRVKAGYGGVGAQCEVCQQEIQPHQVEYEVTDGAGRRTLWLHFRCHCAWQAECTSRQAKKLPAA